MDAPTRVCCGKKHFGCVCPDNKVMCCLCWERFNQSDLNELKNGRKEDVCKPCGESERKKMESRL